jgi:hypothetical protein
MVKSCYVEERTNLSGNNKQLHQQYDPENKSILVILLCSVLGYIFLA